MVASQAHGKVRCSLVGTTTAVSGSVLPEHQRHTVPTEIAIGHTAQLEMTHENKVIYDFRLAFYNEKEVGTGLSRIGGAICK